MIDHYEPEMMSSTDYYAFGEAMPGRRFITTSYRYGYENQEQDPELLNGTISFEFRVEDPRIGKFFSVDPLTSSFPWNSPYAFSENRVTNSVELEGLEAHDLTSGSVDYSSGQQGPQPESQYTVYGPYKSKGSAIGGVISGQNDISVRATTVEDSRVYGMPSFVSDPSRVDEYIYDHGIDYFAPKLPNISSNATQWEKDFAQYNYEAETNRWNNLSYEDKWNETYQRIMLDGYCKNSQKFCKPVAELYTLEAELGGSGLGSGPSIFAVRAATSSAIREGTFAERLFLSEKFGITSEKFGSSLVKSQGSLNRPGGWFKMGWSNVAENGGGMQMRIGIGSKLSNRNQALFHLYFPKTFVPNNFANPSMQVKLSLFKLGL